MNQARRWDRAVDSASPITAQRNVTMQKPRTHKCENRLGYTYAVFSEVQNAWVQGRGTSNNRRSYSTGSWQKGHFIYLGSTAHYRMSEVKTKPIAFTCLCQIPSRLEKLNANQCD
jgi:hypothetical protein